MVDNRMLEHGLWCGGCNRLLELWMYNAVSSGELVNCLSDISDWREELVAKSRRSWSRAEFLQYVLHCPGARKVAAGLWESPVK